MDFDLDKFYHERDDIMNQPDEDLGTYWKHMSTGIKSHFTQENSPSNFAPFPFREDSNESEVPNGLRIHSDGLGGSCPSLQRVPSPARLSNAHLDKREVPSSRPGTRTPSVDPMSENEKTPDDQHVRPQTSLSDPRMPISDSSRLIASETGNRIYEPEKGSRAESIAIKRNASPIHSASPAKRRKDGKPWSTRNDISIQHSTKPLKKSQLTGSTLQTKFEQNMTDAIEEEIERPSEILSFMSSPKYSSRNRSPPGLSSPISSFSPGVTPFNPQNFRTGLKRQQVTNNGSIQHNTDNGYRPTSPIEDSSAQNIPALDVEDHATGIAASSSTKLSLVVKERVAKHAAMRRREKDIPPRSEGTESRSPGRSQSKKDLIPEGKTPSASSHAISPPTSEALKPKGAHRGNVALRSQKRLNGKKEKPRLMTPAEYAQELLDKAAKAAEGRRSSVIKFLEGKNIFYIGGDMQYAGERTRGRMELIVKHGGHLIPTFDPAIVTHIVTDAPKNSTLRTLGYSRLSDIPDHIPTVKWDWILSAIGRPGQLKEDILAKMEKIWYYAAFSERMETSASHSRTLKIKACQDKTSGSPTPGGPTAPAQSSYLGNRDLDSLKNKSDCSTSPQPYVEKGKGRENSEETTGRRLSIDPLAEFYAEARAAHENNSRCMRSKWSRFGDFDESSDDDIEPVADEPSLQNQETKQKRGWTCDAPNAQASSCVNQDIIEKLLELQQLHKAKVGDEEHWRAYSYNKSIRAIRTYARRIESYSEARSIRGVGEKTALKIMEILQTGDLRRISYEQTDDVKVTRLFQGIYGVGQSTAFKWYNAGCRTLEDLRNQKGGVCLSPVQMIGLEHYNDINERMPRAEAKTIFEHIKTIALSFDSKLFIEIMGSFRRGKADCGDVDILITRPTSDGQTHSGILKRLLDALHKGGIITEDLAVPENLADLECIYRGLCRLPRPGSRRRRIDFLTVPWENRGAALLYYTGDDIFNRVMRLKANKLGYSLNQRGLYSGVVRDVKDSRIKLNQGTLVASETEQEIFRILNVPWQEPHERVRG